MTLQEADKLIKEFEAKYTEDSEDIALNIMRLLMFYRLHAGYAIAWDNAKYLKDAIEHTMQKEVSNVG